MNKNNVNGDLKIVMGSPRPTEKDIDIPPKSAGEKIIKAGEIELSVEKNTPELIAELNRQKRESQER